MLVENQLVEVRWNNCTKRWYEDKGYVFTHRGGKFKVKATDLPIGSKQSVKVECDYCHQVLDVTFYNYNKYIKRGNGLYCCSKCKGNKIRQYYINNDAKDKIDKFYSYCKKYGHRPISTIQDYQNVFGNLYFECSIHGLQSKPLHSMDENHNICKWCSYEESASKRRIDTQSLIAFVESKNGNILINPEDYTTRKDKNLLVRCGSCGNIFITSYDILSITSGHCHDCGVKLSYAGKNRISQNRVKEIIELVNGNEWVNQNEYVTLGEKKFNY